MDAQLPLGEAIQVIIPGQPVAWARARTHGKLHYTPRVQRSMMADVRVLAAAAMVHKRPLEGPVALTVIVTWPIPPSWSRKRAIATVWRTGKPDADNLGKLYADALQGIAYTNDAQVTRLVVEKLVGPQAQVTIRVEPL